MVLSKFEEFSSDGVADAESVWHRVAGNEFMVGYRISRRRICGATRREEDTCTGIVQTESEY